MSSLFISDLHLQPGSSEVTAHLLSLLENLAPRYDNLWILGDFVEYWLGDDAYDGSLDTVFDAMRALSKTGTRIRVLFGNRDFLLGDNFAARTGSEVISDDSVVVEDAGRKLVLLHGDTLCTDDTGYQALRKMLRNPAFIAEFLGKPVPDRVQQAMALREQSRSETADKSDEIMDVNPQTVADVMQASGADLMIHGHTHRPAIHQAPETALGVRVVLGDWNETGAKVATLSNDGELELTHWPREAL